MWNQTTFATFAILLLLGAGCSSPPTPRTQDDASLHARYETSDGHQMELRSLDLARIWSHAGEPVTVRPILAELESNDGSFPRSSIIAYVDRDGRQVAQELLTCPDVENKACIASIEFAYGGGLPPFGLWLPQVSLDQQWNWGAPRNISVLHDGTTHSIAGGWFSDYDRFAIRQGALSFSNSSVFPDSIAIHAGDGTIYTFHLVDWRDGSGLLDGADQVEFPEAPPTGRRLGPLYPGAEKPLLDAPLSDDEVLSKIRESFRETSEYVDGPGCIYLVTHFPNARTEAPGGLYTTQAHKWELRASLPNGSERIWTYQARTGGVANSSELMPASPTGVANDAAAIRCNEAAWPAQPRISTHEALQRIESIQWPTKANTFYMIRYFDDGERFLRSFEIFGIARALPSEQTVGVPHSMGIDPATGWIFSMTAPRGILHDWFDEPFSPT